MTTYTLEFPAGCFRNIPSVESVLYGIDRYGSEFKIQLTEFTMPLFAMNAARYVTEDNASKLTGLFEEISKQHPMAMVIFVRAVFADVSRGMVALRNREFATYVAKLATYF
jgi:hypothetical protein